MYIFSPKEAVEIFKSKDGKDKFLMKVTKNIRKSALKNINKEVSKSELINCVEHIKEYFEIDFKTEEFNEILKLYPYERCVLIEYGFDDTTVRESMSDVLANFFIESRGISYGDVTNDDSLKNEFFEMIKQLAKEYGYKVV